jgi:Family of unknown function (DUF6318)
VAIPPEATKRTEEGAKAFARFFWESASRTLVTNDAATVSALSASSCKPCKVFADIARGEAAKGIHSDKASYDIKIVRIVTGEPSHFTVSVAGDELPVNKVDRAGKVVERTKQGVFSWATEVAWRGRWMVTAFEAE